MQPTQAQLKKLERLAKVLDNGDVELLSQIDQLEEKLDSEVQAIQSVVTDALSVAENTKKLEGPQGIPGKDGETIVGPKGDKGERGDSIVGPMGPAGKDGKSIVGPVGPMGPAGKDGADGFVDLATVAYLEEEVAKAKLDKEAYDRALGIVDQRTSFLVNKASNLERIKIDGIGVHTITVSDTAPPSPQAGDIWIDTDAYNYRLVTSSGAITTEDYCIGCDGTLTVTLPTAVSFTGEFIIKNIGTGSVTVQGTSSQMIDSSTVQVLAANESLTVRSNNANWLII